MKIIDPGHSYLLSLYDRIPGEIRTVQTIDFMKRIGRGYPGNVGTLHSGTNCQELLRVVHDRVGYLNNVNIPHERNGKIAHHLVQALLEFELRAAERHGYGAEATQRLFDLQEIGSLMSTPTCYHCGHIVCRNPGHIFMEEQGERVR